MSKRLEKELKSVKSKVTKLERAPEIKELNVFHQSTYTVLLNTGQIFNCTQIVAGDDYNMRSGREIKPMGFEYAIHVRGSQTNFAVNNPIPFRLIITQDMGYDGTARTVDQIIEGYSAVAGNNDNFTSGYNDDYVRTSDHNKQNPVKILKDVQGWLSPVVSGYGKTGQWVKGKISGSRLSKVSYSGVNAADTRAGTILIYFLPGTASAVAADNNQLVMRTTINFTDL